MIASFDYHYHNSFRFLIYIRLVLNNKSPNWHKKANPEGLQVAVVVVVEVVVVV